MNAYQIPWEASLLFLLLGLALGLFLVFARAATYSRWLRVGALTCLVLAVLLFVGGVALGAPLDFSGAPVVTSPTAPPPLRSRVYTVAPANDIFREAVIAADTQRTLGRRWQVVEQRPTPISGGTIRVLIPNLIGTDVLVANIRPEEGGVQVDAQSRSPAGIFGLGGPRREVAQFLAALDERVAARQ
jgi:hypothetical protein